jgi:hypothetical protein
MFQSAHDACADYSLGPRKCWLFNANQIDILAGEAYGSGVNVKLLALNGSLHGATIPQSFAWTMARSLSPWPSLNGQNIEKRLVDRNPE